jgi:RNA polymerase sigma-19 factor, ECF subfamily
MHAYASLPGGLLPGFFIWLERPFSRVAKFHYFASGLLPFLPNIRLIFPCCGALHIYRLTMTGPAHIDERELFLRIAEGDENAFRECYHHYGRLLFPFLFRFTRSEPMAEDLVQETLLRVWLRRDQLVAIEHPRAWVFRIASNLALTWLERQGVQQRVLAAVGTESADTSDPQEILTVRAIRQVVLEAVAEMPERRRMIYQLHRQEGLKTSEIASRLGVTESTVRNTLMAAIRYVREQVEKAGYTLPLWLILLFF